MRLSTVFDRDQINSKLSSISEKLQDPEIYSNIEEYSALAKEQSLLSKNLAEIDEMTRKMQEIEEFISLGDDSLSQDILEQIRALQRVVDECYTTTLLSRPYDTCNCIVKLHSGAGGTEACDWVAMVYRMYSMYVARLGYKLTELDHVDGDGAGYKSITFRVEGDYAYGYFKCEHGVHRLVRISPFDANKRRHTSFLSCEVTPIVTHDCDIVIDTKDLVIDTYRSSGAGGQHVNTTDSAIRITHIPTGIVVTCQNERSQIQNKAAALEILKGKLLVLKEQEEQNKLLALKGVEKKIEWGSQIRSYVFCPYTMCKDHRTGYETSDIEGVMDGDIHAFVIEYLKYLN